MKPSKKLHLVPAEASTSSAATAARANARVSRAVEGCKLLGWMLAGGTIGEIASMVLQAFGVSP